MCAEDQRQVAWWLLVCCALVFSMVVLGGVTRLTGSGLSMVKWAPLTGFVPPMNEAGWEQEFAHYRQSPEYLKINAGMDLAGFKRIYWFEFAHRVLGRTIGVIFLLPFLYFLLRRKVGRRLVPRLVVVFILGGLQGLLGWYMVKSGLVDNPHVSQYRLTAHLLAAVAIYTYMLWLALDLLADSRPTVESPARNIRLLSPAVTVLTLITLVSGGFVAGTKAGFAYNTFPLMGGKWIPDGIFDMSPLYLNLFENIATIQFDHRLLATVLLSMVVVLWLSAAMNRPGQRLRLGIHLLLATALAQMALGISTLLLQVPVVLAATHQAGALVLLSMSLFVSHESALSTKGSLDPGQTASLPSR